MTILQLEMLDKKDVIKKNEEFIKLIDEWLADTSDFEEKTWPLVKDMFKKEETV